LEVAALHNSIPKAMTSPWQCQQSTLKQKAGISCKQQFEIRRDFLSAMFVKFV
jgi:hypothetical protein